MHVTTTKSKNAESFYITKTYKTNTGATTSKIVRKLGTLQELSEKLDTNRDGVIAWARGQAKIETEKYKKGNEDKTVIIPFHADRLLDYDKQKFFLGGYLFLQSVYYELKLDHVCRKIKSKHLFEYDLNAILSDLVYARVLEPDSKRSPYRTAKKFLEPPSYGLHDIYRALSVLADECDLVQSEVYKNSHFVTKRNDKILYIMTVPIIILKSSRKTVIKSMGKAKNTGRTQSYRWGFLLMGTASRLHFPSFPATGMNRYQ